MRRESELQEQRVRALLYPSTARSVIATPVNPPVKGQRDDDSSGTAHERGSGQQHPHG